MSNSFPIIFLILAGVVLVFGIGIVVLNRRKKPAPFVVEPVVEPVIEKRRSVKNVLAGAVS